MRIAGTIIEVLPLESGTSHTGSWQKQDYILETSGEYSKKICFSLWNDKIGEFHVQEGQEVVVSVDIESKPFQGKWYTNIKGWKVELQADLLEYEKEDISLYLSDKKEKERVELMFDEGYRMVYEAAEGDFLEHKAKAITVLSFVDDKGADVLAQHFPQGVPYKTKKVIGNYFYLHVKERVVKQKQTIPLQVN